MGDIIRELEEIGPLGQKILDNLRKGSDPKIKAKLKNIFPDYRLPDKQKQETDADGQM